MRVSEHSGWNYYTNALLPRRPQSVARGHAVCCMYQLCTKLCAVCIHNALCMYPLCTMLCAVCTHYVPWCALYVPIICTMLCAVCTHYVPCNCAAVYWLAWIIFKVLGTFNKQNCEPRINEFNSALKESYYRTSVLISTDDGCWISKTFQY